MYKKYLTNALRHLRHSRLFTTLNILGLAFSISACMVIYRIVDYEFSYDKQVVNRQNIYRVITGFTYDGKTSYNGGAAAPLYKALRKESLGINRVIPVISNIWFKDAQANLPGVKPVTVEEPEGITQTDSTYFAMVPYHWLAGNGAVALQIPNRVVLTESRAKEYFPGKKPEEIINQSITYHSWHDTVTRVVSGVVADLTGPTEFIYKEFISLSTKEDQLVAWTNTNGGDKVYLELEEKADPKKIRAYIESTVAHKIAEFNGGKKDPPHNSRWYELMPLSESHFSTRVGEWDVHKINKNLLFGLIGAAIFLLTLACINYINMGIASIPQRSKEIGVRKTLGSSRRELISQFLTETFITSIAACVVASGLAWLEFKLLKDIMPPGLDPSVNTWQIIGFMLVLSLATTILSGIYPGWLIAKVKTIQVFRHTFVLKGNGGRGNFQRALIVFQFVIAIVFITATLIVGKQLHYAINADMGFNKDAVILTSVPWKYSQKPAYKGKQFSLLAELRTIQGVKEVAMGTIPLTNNFSSGSYSYYRQGKPPINRNLYFKNVDTAYLHLYGFQLLAGHNITPTDTTKEFVINETAVRAFGFKSPQDAIGKMIGQNESLLTPIVGVVKDFHMQDFYTTIDPMTFKSDKEDLLTFNIKLDNQQVASWPQTIKAIEKKWNSFYPPETFSYKFYDESIAQLYKSEHNLSILISLTTAICIFISCLGLFGLAVLTATQRTKEIGIRKVLGASVTGIVGMLSKQYLQLVALAILIATPIAWYGTNKWLQNFAYKIDLQWWLFALAGLSGLAVAFLAVGFHALKAARANPIKSLRTE